MEAEPLKTVEAPEDPKSSDPAATRLNMAVAITVAILATFMGICKVKDDNIVQAMQQAQANKLDHWAFYQARNIREELAKSMVVQLQLTAASRPAAEQARYREAIKKYELLAAEQARKKEELRVLAEQAQKDYDAANFKDDQFDLSDALIAIAISLLAMTALTRQKWLFAVALIPTGFGVFMGVASVLGFTSGIEGFLWLGIGLICASVIVWRAPGRSFQHGFLVGLIAGTVASLLQFLFFPTYMSNNPDLATRFFQVPGGLSARSFVLILAPIIGLVSGIVLGTVCWAVARLFGKGRAAA